VLEDYLCYGFGQFFGLMPNIQRVKCFVKSGILTFQEYEGQFIIDRAKFHLSLLIVAIIAVDTSVTSSAIFIPLSALLYIGN
jgi:hypothetical protein